jgi:phosphoglycerol transferase
VTTFKSHLAAVLLCLVFLTLTMKLWKADFHVPFSYGLDSLFYSTVIKGTIENGWYLQNSSLGAPGTANLHDFPIPDGVNFLLIKLLSLIRSDYPWVLNVFYLLTFPLTTVFSMFVFREFKLSHFSSIVWSLLYTFTPFHFFPGMAHLFVATYYVVPLAAGVALWVCSGELLTARDNDRTATPRVNFRSRKFVLSIIACVLVSSVGFAYYAFFACFFILVGAITAAVTYRNLRYCLPALVFTGVITAGLLINLAPNFIYFYRHGNPQVAQRGLQDTETFGLKIAPMLLPIRDHRIPSLAKLTERYSAEAPSVASEMAPLGLIGSIGFLALLGWLLFGKEAGRVEGSRGLLNRLSVLNVAGVLLGVVGGFSSIFALIISAQIRSYHRISVFLAFFCLLGIALIIEEVFRRRRNSIPAFLRYGALVLILVLGILDQTSERFVPAYAQNKAEFVNDDKFVRRIEQLLPARAMVFQLPYVQFPEGAPANVLTDYELSRGYLHSRDLHWSYGAMKKREGDQWLAQVTQKPLPEMLEAIVFAGFQGIYIDRLGYRDFAIENQLHGILRQPPLLSDNERLAFFDLTEFSNQVRQQYSPSEWAQKREDVLYPVVLTWGGGCWDREGTEENNWNWCSKTGELKIANYSRRPRRLELEMELFSGHPQPSQIRIHGLELSDAFLINDKGQKFTANVTVAPGNSTISFASDAQSVTSPGDGRNLVFRVVNFRWKAL